jgi:hypothetical protein
MRCRLTKTGMSLALLLSAWGNVFAASLCPRMEQGHACCRARRASLPECHKGMTDMRAGHEHIEVASEQESDAESISRPSESCAHCMGHSQPPPSPALVREAGQVNLCTNLHLTLKPAEPGSFAAGLTRIVAAGEHSPPEAQTSSRHVLINVFRI